MSRISPLSLDFVLRRISRHRKLSSYSKVQRAVGALIRGRRSFHANVQPGAYVHLGCGPNVLKSFLNVDYNWVPGVDICCDITRGLPIGDAIAGGLYSEHCIEHLTLEQTRRVLRECHRVLRPGAVLRVAVPDLETYARAYVRHLDDKSTDMPNEHFVNTSGVSRPVALFNELFMGSDHRFIHDYATLSALLEEAGFASVTRCSYRNGSDSRLLVDSAGRASESLYVEAVKR